MSTPIEELMNEAMKNIRAMVDANTIVGDVITTPDGRTIVIDYKFGEPHHTSHSRQVKDYMTLLSQAGFKNVEGRIWYPFDHRIVAVQ